MITRRFFTFLAVASTLLAAVPASAQFFMKNPDFSGPPVRGDEPGVVVPLPGATEAEMQAGLVWSLRAALNVAALGCDFEPSLLTPSNYNSILRDHDVELAKAYGTLEKYFARTYKTKKEALGEFDRYQTRVYANFTTVSGQYNFCQTAGQVGRDALFIDRGTFGELARMRVRELRNSLSPRGEQRFGGRNSMRVDMVTVRLDPICWNKRGFNYRKCPSPY